ncbi:hypothetical protein G8764_18010 [Pseudomaricurvus alcaniphilus]|nr:hypothetical protein [Pseudomaricurvus alcaniphilus]
MSKVLQLVVRAISKFLVRRVGYCVGEAHTGTGAPTSKSMLSIFSASQPPLRTHSRISISMIGCSSKNYPRLENKGQLKSGFKPNA